MTTIEYYCDPLNPQGWVLEPARRRVAMAFPDASWAYRPAGMVESWEDYDGPELDGGRAALPATCARLSEEYGMPIDEYLWFDDPPTSSWPACEAVAAAGLQSPTLAGRLLRACREATFARRRSVSDPEQLRAVASEVPGLDLEALEAATGDGQASEAYDEHRRAAAAVEAPGIDRGGGRVELPALVATGEGGVAGVSGLAGETGFVQAVAEAADATIPDEARPVSAVLERFSPCGWVAAAELAALGGTSESAAIEAARTLVEADEAVEETFAASPFFRLDPAAE